MITKSTVLILGAGASAPYSYPTGEKLRSEICTELSNSGPMFQLLEKAGYFAKTISEFCRALSYSGKNSVDAFLEHRPDFRDIGTLAIAISIIRRENHGVLFSDSLDKAWYRYFYDNLNCRFDNFGKNAISVITFNYDRSFEHFLFTAIKNTYGKSDAECVNQLASIPIIHVYGQLDKLPWQVTDGNFRSYDNEITIPIIKQSAQGIKIIHDKESVTAFEEAHSILEKAERIFFLGFGYNPINLEKLKIEKWRGRDIRGTALGLSSAEIELAKRYSKSVIDFTTFDVLNFFKYVILD